MYDVNFFFPGLPFAFQIHILGHPYRGTETKGDLNILW